MNNPTVYKTCVEMLIQRDYKIMEEDDMLIMAVKPDNSNMCVLFTEGDNFNMKRMKDIISISREKDVRHAIIVYPDTITSATRNILTRSFETRFELFSHNDLKFNITKHRLQPKFEKISEEGKAELHERFGTQFGKMLVDGPISRFYNYRKGDVIRITRDSGYINYRTVV